LLQKGRSANSRSQAAGGCRTGRFVRQDATKLMEKIMLDAKNVLLSTNQLAMVLDKVPAGITVIDREGRILYYNEYCTRFVDRKPEYIGKDIRFCHQKPESIEKINRIISELNACKIKEFYYESQRGAYKLGVTVSPFDFEGNHIGFIQCFSIIR
jgi:DUF438 domain-containing protein